MEVPFYDLENTPNRSARYLRSRDVKRERYVLVGWLLTTGVSDRYVRSLTNTICADLS